MHLATQNKQPISKQQGAALIVGLIMLAVLTILTASSMNSSTVSLRMADNLKRQDLTQQAAESALSESLRSGEPLTIDASVDYNDPARDRVTYEYTSASSAENVVVDVDTLLRDRLAPTVGGELNAVQGSGGVLYQHFELQAAATADRGSASDQRMGFYIQTPK